MSQLIARRYRPLTPLTGELPLSAPLTAKDTLRGGNVELRRFAPADEARLRFRLATLERLRHGALQAVIDHGRLPDESYYAALTPRQGRSAEDVAPLPPEALPEVIAQLCAALRVLHARGLVHGALDITHVQLSDDFSTQLLPGERLGLDGTVAGDLRALGRLCYHLATGRCAPAAPEAPSAARHNVPAYVDALVLRLWAGDCADVDDALLLLPYAADEKAAVPLPEASLAGRDATLARLAEAHEAATQARQAHVVAVDGEPGAGKTRVIEAAAFAAELAGSLVLRGRSPGEHQAYGPWLDVLHQAVPLVRARHPEVFAACAPALSALVGPLGVESAPPLEPKQESLRLQAAAAELLAALADGPLVLVLEDWQRSDALSRSLLAFLKRQAQDKPLLVLLAGRPEGWADADETLMLASLTPEALLVVARDLLGGRLIAPGLAAVLPEWSAGSPRRLVEVLTYLATADQLRLGEAGWDLAGQVSAPPTAAEDLYSGRLAGLADGAREAARLAAVVGESGELAMLRAMWQGTPEALTAALDALRGHGVLESTGSLYRFTQPGWARALIASLTPAALASLHERAAQRLALWAESGDAPADWMVRRAEHALAGGDANLAIACALEAGRLSVTLNAPGSARRFLEAGFSRYEAAGFQPPELELPFRRYLGDVLRLGGQYPEAVALYERACELSEAAGEPGLTGTMLTSAGKCLQMANRYEEAESFYRRALAVYDGHADTPGRLRALTSLARTKMVVGHRDEGEVLYLEALAAAETGQAPVALAESLGALGLMIVSNDPGRVPEGIAFLERSIEIRRGLGDKVGLNDSYSLLGNAYMALGQLPRAKEAFTRNQRLCFEAGIVDEEIFAFLNLAIVSLEMGHFRRMRELAGRAEAGARRSGSQFTLSIALAFQALAETHLGELSAVQARLDEAQAAAEALGNKYLLINLLVYVSEIHLIFGRLTDAVDVALRAQELMAELNYREYEARLLILHGEIHGRLGEREEARGRLERAQLLARESQNTAVLARVLKTLAWLGVQEKNWLEARDHAKQALEVAQAIGAEHLAGEAAWLLGEIELGAGQMEQAERWLLKALAAGEASESPHLQGQALFCLARASGEESKTREYLFQARDLLRAQLAQLDGVDREDYLSLAERWRVDRGELVFSEKARQKLGQSELGVEGRVFLERLRRFAAFSRALHGGTSADWSPEGSLPALLELMDAQRVAVMLPGAAAPFAQHGRGGEIAEADRQVLSTLAGSTGTFYQPFLAEDARFSGLYAEFPASLLAVPFPQGVVLAVRRGQPFGKEEIEVFELAAAQLAVAAANARIPSRERR